MNHIFGYYSQNQDPVLKQVFTENFFKFFNNTTDISFWQKNTFNRESNFDQAYTNGKIFDTPEILNHAHVGLGIAKGTYNTNLEEQPLDYQGVKAVYAGTITYPEEDGYSLPEAFYKNSTEKLGGTFASAIYLSDNLYLNSRVVPIYLYVISSNSWIFCSKELDIYLNVNNIFYKKMPFPAFSSILINKEKGATSWSNILPNNFAITYDEKLLSFLIKNYQVVYLVTENKEEAEKRISLPKDNLYIIESNTASPYTKTLDKFSYLANTCDEFSIGNIILGADFTTEEYIEVFNNIQKFLDLTTEIKPRIKFVG